MLAILCPPAVKSSTPVRCVAALQEFVENADLAKGPQSRAAKRDARAVRSPAGIDLDDLHVRARLAQLDGGGHA